MYGARMKACGSRCRRSSRSTRSSRKRRLGCASLSPRPRPCRGSEASSAARRAAAAGSPSCSICRAAKSRWRSPAGSASIRRFALRSNRCPASSTFTRSENEKTLSRCGRGSWAGTFSAYCTVERVVGAMRVTTFFSRSRRSGMRGAISFFQWSLSYTALVERLALRLALKPAQPDIHRLIGFTAEAAGDHHALGDLERDDLLLHDLEPFLHLAGPDLVLAQLVEGHRRRSSRVFRQWWVTLVSGSQ